VLAGLRVQLLIGLLHTKETADLCADEQKHTLSFRIAGSAQRMRNY